MKSAKRIYVWGRVKQVGYRDWTVRTARQLGVTGWVRNRQDGSVELHAEGTEEAIDALIEACHTGPAQARVERIESQAASDESIRGFNKRFGV